MADSNTVKSKSTASDAAKNTTTVDPIWSNDAVAEDSCRRWVASFYENRTIQFLIDHLHNTLGCKTKADTIQCRKCDQPAAGMFALLHDKQAVTSETTMEELQRNMSNCLQKEQHQKQKKSLLSNTSSTSNTSTIEPAVYICQQYMRDEMHAHRTIVHELIHAIDACRTNMDPTRNCVQLACTEIRAENLSGECDFWREFYDKGQVTAEFAGHGKECVRRRAVLSVRGNPKCAKRAEEYVDAALLRCYQDLYPFEQHPSHPNFTLKQTQQKETTGR
jgi:inner membrane protease ATP23